MIGWSCIIILCKIVTDNKYTMSSSHNYYPYPYQVWWWWCMALMYAITHWLLLLFISASISSPTCSTYPIFYSARTAICYKLLTVSCPIIIAMCLYSSNYSTVCSIYLNSLMPFNLLYKCSHFIWLRNSISSYYSISSKDNYSLSSSIYCY